MTRWPYLQTPAFEIRHVLAGWYLRTRMILEIGAEGRTVDPYAVWPGTEKVLAIGPNMKAHEAPGVSHRPWRFEQVQWVWSRELLPPGPRRVHLLENDLGVLLMGIELMMPPPAWSTLYSILNRAKVVMLEHAEDHIHSVRQVAQIRANTQLVETRSFVLELKSKHGRRRMIIMGGKK
jgi:hypothetical protein